MEPPSPRNDATLSDSGAHKEMPLAAFGSQSLPEGAGTGAGAGAASALPPPRARREQRPPSPPAWDASLQHDESINGPDRDAALAADAVVQEATALPQDDAWGVRGLIREFPGNDIEAAALYRDYEQMLLYEAKIDVISTAMSRILHTPALESLTPTLESLGNLVVSLSEKLAAAKPERSGVLEGDAPNTLRGRANSLAGRVEQVRRATSEHR